MTSAGGSFSWSSAGGAVPPPGSEGVVALPSTLVSWKQEDVLSAHAGKSSGGKKNPGREVGIYLVGAAELRRGCGLLQRHWRGSRARRAGEVSHVSHLIHCHKVTHVERELFLLLLLLLFPLPEKRSKVTNEILKVQFMI